MVTPRVTDISHHNTVTNLRSTGLWGVIHKATQGISYKDSTYTQRRPLAAAAGMLWGAYHFGDSSDPVAQVNYFLAYARPDAKTLLCLDYEDHPSGKSRTMKPDQMVKFLREIERQTGTKATLYSGNRIKEDLSKLSAKDQAYVSSHKLWLCQYGNTPRFPPSFGRTFLWQYTDGVVGPEPRRVPGITGQVDLNAFNGSRNDLETAWVGLATSTDLSSQSRRGLVDEAEEEEVVPKPARGSEEDEPINIQPQTVGYSVDVEILQKKLDKLGYHDVGEIDGRWGGKIKGALTAFLNDRGSDIVVNGGPTPEINAAISQALSEGWTRPISESRATATAKDIAPKVEVVRQTLFQRLGAKIAAGFAALGLTGSSLSSTFETVRDKIEPFREFMKSIPPEVWFIALGLVAGLSWYLTNRALKSAEKDYNTGKIN